MQRGLVDCRCGGCPFSEQTLFQHAAHSLAGYRSGVPCPPIANQYGVSLPPQCPRPAGYSRHCLSASQVGNLRARLFLAPPSLSLRTSRPSNTQRVLVGEVRRQHGERSQGLTTTQDGRVDRPHRLGVPTFQRGKDARPARAVLGWSNPAAQLTPLVWLVGHIALFRAIDRMAGAYASESPRSGLVRAS